MTRPQLHRYIVTIYCGTRGPVQDMHVEAHTPTDAVAHAMNMVRDPYRTSLTELRVNRRED